MKKIIYCMYMIFFSLRMVMYRILNFFSKDRTRLYLERILFKWSKFTINIIGIDIAVYGAENIPDEPCVFVSNHTSILDIPVIFESSERIIGFVAKKELQKVPVVASVIKAVGGVFLDRDDVRSAIKVINDASSKLKEGVSVGVFPEGTRCPSGELGDFKKGSLKIATKSKAKIIPVAIHGLYECYEKDRKFVRGSATISYGEAIDTSALDKESLKNIDVLVYGSIKDMLVLQAKK